MSDQIRHSVMSDSLRPHESQHARPPCPSPTPGVHSDSRQLSQWCHPAISSSVVPFSSCPQSLPASESLPMSQLFTWGGQSTGGSASAPVLPMYIQGWFPLGLTGLISLHSEESSLAPHFESISSSSVYSGLISFRIDWFDLLAVQGTLKSLPVPQLERIHSSVLSLLYGPSSYIWMSKTGWMVLVTSGLNCTDVL